MVCNPFVVTVSSLFLGVRCVSRVRSTSPEGYSTQNEEALPYSIGSATCGRGKGMLYNCD